MGDAGGDDGKLNRSLDLRSATCIVMGSMIGSGIFIVGAEVTQSVPSAMGALAVWVFAGFFSLMGGLTMAELGAMFPGSGGPYLYLREAFHQMLGFLYGWVSALIIYPASIAAVAVAFAKFAGYIVAMTMVQQQLVASVVVLVFTAINLMGVTRGAGVLDFLTFLKVVALLAIAGAGLVLPSTQSISASATEPLTVTGFGVALIAAFWAYDGWIGLPYVAGEVREPQKNVPRSLLWGIFGVGVLYTLVNLALYRFVPVAQVAASAFPVADAASVMAGGSVAAGSSVTSVTPAAAAASLPTAVLCVVFAVLLSTLGCVNGMILGGARMTYAMSIDGVLPGWLGYVHPVSRVPSTSLVAQMFVTLCLVWSGRYDQLYTCVVAVAFVFYGLSAAAVFVLRRDRPEFPRPYKVPLYPWLPLGYLLFVIAFIGNTLHAKPIESFIGLGIMATGVPVYLWQRRSALMGPEVAGPAGA